MAMAIGLVLGGCGTVARLVLELDVVWRDRVVPDDRDLAQLFHCRAMVHSSAVRKKVEVVMAGAGNVFPFSYTWEIPGCILVFSWQHCLF